MTLIMKFGGTSVGDAARIRQVCSLIAARRARQPVVVVSALAGVTSRLLLACECALRRDETQVAAHLSWIDERHREVIAGLELPTDQRRACLDALDASLELVAELTRGIALLSESTPRARDTVAAQGELISHVIVAAALEAQGVPALAVDPRQILRTDERFGAAEVDRDTTRELAQKCLADVAARGIVPITGGYVGATSLGIVTTLGRGGGDLSATHLAAAIDAEEVEIWTDVDGILTADPRVVPTARTLARVSFQEAAELAYFGAKVLHPATIRPAVERQIPVRVLNTMAPERPGTVIGDGDPSHPPGESFVRAVAWRTGIATVSVSSPRMLGASGFLARVFTAFERRGIAVDVVTTSEVSVSMTVDRTEGLDALAAELMTFCEVRVERGLSLVCLVGHDLLESPKLVSEVLAVLDPIPLRMFCLGSSDVNLTFVVREGDAEDVVRRLHARFLEAT